MKQKITEQDKVHEEWFIQAKDMTLANLPEFLRHLMEDYEHDYGTICHALSAGGIATMWAMNKEEQGGITGFQAGAVMWTFIRNWNYEGNKTSMRILDFDNMLYPQYEDKFQKTISQDVWLLLQEEAKVRLDKDAKSEFGANENVVKHWKSIVNGDIPFGYRIDDTL